MGRKKCPAVSNASTALLPAPARSRCPSCLTVDDDSLRQHPFRRPRRVVPASVAHRKNVAARGSVCSNSEIDGRVEDDDRRANRFAYGNWQGNDQRLHLAVTTVRSRLLCVVGRHSTKPFGSKTMSQLFCRFGSTFDAADMRWRPGSST